MLFCRKSTEVAMLSSQEGTVEGTFNSLRIAFTDDDGNYCALAISCLRDDPDPTKLKTGEKIPSVEERKHLFTVAFIKNTTLAPNKREVTVLSDPIFMEGNKNPKVSEIEAGSVPTEVDRLINSKNLSKLLEGLFNDDSISMEKLNELSRRIQVNSNVDNRDFKQQQLKELRALMVDMPNNTDLLQDLRGVIANSSSDVDFFKSGEYEKRLEEIYTKINSHIEQQDLDENIKKELLLKNKLTYFAMRLELQSFDVDIDNSRDLLHSELCKEQARDLRVLRDNPEGEKEKYDDMTLSELTDYVEKKASKLHQLKKFMNDNIKKCEGDEEALANLRQIENDVINDIDSYTEDSLEMSLVVQEEIFGLYIAELNYQKVYILQGNLRSLADQIESYAAQLPKNSPDYIRSGLLDKAKELRDLVDIEQKDPASKLMAKQYGKQDIKTVISNCINDSFGLELDNQIRNLEKEIKAEKEKLIPPKAPADKDTTFLRRNIGTILAGTTLILLGAAITVFLALTIPPLAVLTGVVTALAASKTAEAIADNEEEHQHEIQKYSETSASYEAEKTALDDSFKARKAALTDSLDQTKSAFMSSMTKEKNDVSLDLESQPDAELKETATIETGFIVDQLIDQVSTQITAGEEAVRQGVETVVELPISQEVTSKVRALKIEKPTEDDQLSVSESLNVKR